MPSLEDITNERFKERSCPGSLTYYLENKFANNKFTTEKTYTNEEINMYFPRCFVNDFKYGKSPEEELNILGWKYDEEKEKFYHNKYFIKEQSKKTHIYFDVGIKLWNKKRYYVPLQQEGHLDNLGITWSYKKDGAFFSLERNKVLDYWNSRKGKRMAKYIEYRKLREKRSQMFQNIKT